MVVAVVVVVAVSIIRLHTPTARDTAHHDTPCNATPTPTHAATGAPTTHNPIDTSNTSERIVVGGVYCQDESFTMVRHHRARVLHQPIPCVAMANRAHVHKGESIAVSVNGDEGWLFIAQSVLSRLSCIPTPSMLFITLSITPSTGPADPNHGANCINCNAIAP